MSRVVFFNIPAHGHTNPTLSVVRELVEQGEEVIYYSFPEFKDKIEVTGATFKSYQIDASHYKEEELKEFPILFRVFMEATSQLLSGLLQEVRLLKPDYLIHDSLCVWGKYIGQILKLPTICSNTTFAFDESFVNVRQEIINSLYSLIRGDVKHLWKGLSIQRSLCKQYGLAKPPLLDFLKNKENLNIVYTSKTFQPAGETFDDTYRFVGPSLQIKEIAPSSFLPLTEKPVIYISLGTIFGDHPQFYEQCFQAFGDLDALFILSLGNKFDKSRFSTIPTNFKVYNYAPQLEVLQQASIFISHGGMNSVQESLYYGVPLIIFPQQQEQQMVATQVESLGCGIYLKKTTCSTLRASVEQVLSSPDYKGNALSIGKTLHEAGGYKRAVQEIMKMKKTLHLDK